VVLPFYQVLVFYKAVPEQLLDGVVVQKVCSELHARLLAEKRWLNREVPDQVYLLSCVGTAVGLTLLSEHFQFLNLTTVTFFGH
jgi:hypothetical protein